MTFGDDFVTYRMNVPASRKGQDVSYLRRIESSGKGIERMINDQSSSQLEKAFTGYSASYDAQAKQVILSVTTMKKNEKLLGDAMRSSLMQRGKGAFSPTAKKSATISGGAAGYVPVSMEGLRGTENAKLMYTMSKDLGVSKTDAGEGVMLPENIRYTSAVARKVRQVTTKNAAAPAKEEDHLLWRRELERDRQRRSIDLGTKAGNLDFKLPENNKYGISQDFVDKQNEYLKQERERQNAGDSKGLGLSIAKVASILYLINRTVSKIYELSKQGAERSLQTMISSIELGLDASTIGTLRNKELGLGMQEGTTETGLKRLVAAYNSPDAIAQSDKMTKGLALLAANTNQRNTLVQSAISIGTEGSSVMPLYQGIMSAARELIGSGRDVFGNNVGGSQSMRSVVQFISSNISPELASLLSHELQYNVNTESSNPDIGLSVSGNDTEHAASLATSIGEFNSILKSLNQILASWLDKTGIIDKLNSFLINHFGTSTEKAELRMYNQTVNKERNDAVKSTMRNLNATPTMKGFTDFLTNGPARYGLNKDTGFIEAGNPFKRYSLSDLAKGLSGDKSAFDFSNRAAVILMADSIDKNLKSRSITDAQREYLTQLKSKLPEMYLYGGAQQALASGASGYRREDTDITQQTPQTILSEFFSAAQDSSKLKGFSGIDLLDTLALSDKGRKVFGNKSISGELSGAEYAGTIAAGVVNPVFNSISRSAVRPGSVTSNFDLLNNIQITTPEGKTSYEDKKSYSTNSLGGSKIFSTNIYESKNSNVPNFDTGNVVSNMQKKTQSAGK